MNKKQLIAITAVAAVAAVAVTTFYMFRKRKHKKRSEFAANAGYELAYDVHFPVKYKRQVGI
jgi:hypothetical protein